MSDQTKTNERTIAVLNDQISICRDGSKGLEEAAGYVQDAALKKHLDELAGERGRFAAELEAHVLGLGGEPAHRGTVSGAVHRAWIDLKSTFGAGDHALLASAECMEDRSLDEYRKALKEPDLAADSRALIERQLEHLDRAHDWVRAARDAHAAA